MEDLTSRPSRPSVPRHLQQSFSRLGETVAKVSDRTADPTTLPNARRRWLSASSLEVPSVWQRVLSALRVRLGPGSAESIASGNRISAASATSAGRSRLLIVAFAAVAIAAAALVAWPREPAISFSVGASTEPGTVGQWVAPEAGTPVDLRFSEGTLVTLASGARMRVTDTAPDGATLLIERGSIHAAITHRGPDTRWSVKAGPFEVRVTGTSFDASWDPATETFELAMLEGSVIVSGPRLPSGRPVVGGEHLLVSRTHMELRAGAAPAAQRPAVGPARPAACASPVTAAPQPVPTSSPSADPSSTPAPATSGLDPDRPAASSSPATAPASWKALAATGKYREAMDAAEAAGFSGELSRASASELLSLAEAARFAGRPARAKEALLAARKRGSRGNSAFLLGKIAADQLNSPGEATTWFETYLQEQPGGALAEQALGRLLEMRKGDPGAGRVIAERYLARYPNGAYKKLARSLTGTR
jgi:transmembrane sensor